MAQNGRYSRTPHFRGVFAFSDNKKRMTAPGFLNRPRGGRLSVLTMVRAMAPIVNVVWLNAERTFHPADNAADPGANHGSDWPSDAAPFIKALRGASGNSALCRRGQRHGNRHNTRACDEPLHSHRSLPLLR